MPNSCHNSDNRCGQVDEIFWANVNRTAVHSAVGVAEVQAEAERIEIGRVEIGTAMKLDHVNAKAARIKAEIDLHRAKKGL